MTAPAPRSSGRIRDEVIAAIREKAPIADIVGEYVTLRRSGSSMVGLCPFHDERSPSFHVSPGKNAWHCFGCGEGGDVFAFVQKIEQVGFLDAVERLAVKAGVEVVYTDGARPAGLPASQRARLVAANEAAVMFYRSCLASPEGAAGREYLTGRGFDAEAVAAFEIGFSPTGWDGLLTHLKAQGFTVSELVTVGLVVERENKSGVYDRFRGRLMWPIRDVTGDVIGFGARKIAGDDQGPKYLNTPETPLYKKSDVLYGLHQARRAIASSKQIVVVEGYTDVMACHLAGVTNAVAACGTAFGDGHIRIVRRLMHDNDMFSGKVIFTFDGDAAGQNAALRAFRENARFTAATYVAVAPENMDPSELRQARGAGAVRDLIASAVPLAEFVLRSTIAGQDLDTVEGRTKALKGAAPIVAGLRDAAMRVAYTVTLAGWLGMDERHVREAVARAAKAGAVEQAPASAPAAAEPAPSDVGESRQPVLLPDRRDPALAVEREALKCVLQAGEHTTAWGQLVTDTAFSHPAYQAVWAHQHAGAALEDGYAGLVSQLTVEPLPVAEAGAVAEYVHGALVRLVDRDYQRRIDSVKSRMARGDGDSETLFNELMTLEGLRRELKAWRA